MLIHPRSTILTTSLLLLPIIGSLGCPKEAELPLECGDVRETLGSGSSNIVNGDLSWDPTVVPLTDGQALAVGSVLTPDGFGGWTSICTATVVAPTLALMAAHCVTDRRGRTQPPSDFALGIGDDIERMRAILPPDQVVADPWYNPRSAGAAHDQALFVFDAPVTDTVPELIPIPFNRETTAQSAIGEDIQTVGFGCIDSNCNLYNNLKYWAVEELVEITTFDLTIDGHGVAGVCFGDSGGPVLRDVPGKGIRVLGTLSYGDPDCGNRDHYCITEGEAHFLDLYAPGCGTVTDAGSCAGSTVTYCEDDLPITIDCAATGEVCQDDGSGSFRCIDPCDGETLAGRCDGDDAIWCESGTVKVRRCADCNLSCGFSDTLGYTYCQ